MARLTDLPEELLIAIVQNLRGSPQTIKACALVSRAFGYISQSFLFSQVLANWKTPKSTAICPYPERFDLNRLSSQLRFVPHIAPFIRQLTFQPFSGSGWHDVDTLLFTQVVSQLRSLRVLALRFLSFSKVDDSNGIIVEEQTLQPTPLLPFAREGLDIHKFEAELVNFQDFTTFNKIISIFSSIHVFDVERCFKDHDPKAARKSGNDVAASRLPSEIAPLRTSELRVCPSAKQYLFRALERHIHASQTNPPILKLRISVVYEVDAYSASFVKSIGSTAQVFAVEFYDEAAYPRRGTPSIVRIRDVLPVLDMSRWTTLEGIVIYFGRSFFNSDFEWEGNFHFLGMASHCPSIQHLSIVIANFNDSGPGVLKLAAPRTQLDQDLKLDFTEWGKLDNALVTFRDLQSVRFIFVDKEDRRIEKFKSYLLSRNDLTMVRNRLACFPSHEDQWSYESDYRRSW